MNLEELQNFQLEDLNKIGSAPLVVRIVAVVVICAAVAGLGFYFLINPKITDLENTARKETQLRTEFEQKQRKASNLEAYEEQLEEMKKTFGSMLKSLPDKAEVESLLVEISRAGSANNLKINQFKPTGEVPKEFYAEFPINMRLVGSYGELTGFISSIAALQRIVTLHNIEVSPLDSENNLSELDVKLTAKTYRYLTDEDAN